METLVTCPTCNTPNFTARGLKAHRCKGKSRIQNSESIILSSAPGGRNGREKLQPATAAPGISFWRLLRVFGQAHPRSFRVFWGAMLDDNPRLRKVRDTSGIVLTRAEFKRIMEQAFLAGASK